MLHPRGQLHPQAHGASVGRPRGRGCGDFRRKCLAQGTGQQRRETSGSTYPETLDVKVQIEGLDDHRSSFAQSEPTGGAELLPTDGPGVTNAGERQSPDTKPSRSGTQTCGPMQKKMWILKCLYRG